MYRLSSKDNKAIKAVICSKKSIKTATVAYIANVFTAGMPDKIPKTNNIN